MIHLVSAFRRTHNIDDAYLQHVRRYFRQVANLADLTPTTSHIVWGDSIKALETVLDGVGAKHAPGTIRYFHRYDHGKPDHGSCENPERLTALSGLLNFALDEVSRKVNLEDTAIWVESDLYWDAFTMIQLHRFLQRDHVDVVSPMIFAGEAFYDIWGFRTMDGRRWGPFYPWGDRDDIQGDNLIEMGSVGSCVAMTQEVARTVRVQDGNALVGWCTQAREKYSQRIWCARDLRVQHPFDWRRG